MCDSQPYPTPPLETTEASITEETALQNGKYWAVINAQTGVSTLNAGWSHSPERIVTFSGKLYHSQQKETLISECEMFHIDVTLRRLPKWMRVLSRFTLEKEPDSVEQFFHDFMFNLLKNTNASVPHEDINNTFDTVITTLIQANAFAETNKQPSTKPYCDIYSPSTTPIIPTQI